VRQSESVPPEQVLQVLWHGMQLLFSGFTYMLLGQTGIQAEVKVFRKREPLQLKQFVDKPLQVAQFVSQSKQRFGFVNLY
jgi:hypothetical protein